MMNKLVKLTKVVALFGFLGCVTGALADEDYGLYLNSKDNEKGAFKVSGTKWGSSYNNDTTYYTGTTFEALKDSSLTFTLNKSVEDKTRPHSWWTPSQTYSGNSGSPVTMGVFTYGYDSQGQIVVKDSAVFDNLSVGQSVNTVGYLDINAGDMVGMYIQRTGETSTVETSYLTEGSGAGEGTNKLPEATITRYGDEGGKFLPNYEWTRGFPWGWTQTMTGEGEAYFEMDNSGWPERDDVDIVVSISGASPGVNPASSGAPLPGVLATLFVAGSLSSYAQRRKKKALK